MVAARWSGGAKVISFIRELSTLLAVGIPLLDAIDAIHRQHRGRFGSVLLALRDRVSSGVGLAQAMREQPGVFDDMCVSLTEVGENAGTLEAALERVAEFKERQAALRNKLATALIYPLIVLIMAVGVSLLLMTVVVPNLLGTLADAGRPLPLPTKIVKFASDWLVQRWWVLLVVAIAAGIGMRVVLLNPARPAGVASGAAAAADRGRFDSQAGDRARCASSSRRCCGAGWCSSARFRSPGNRCPTSC